MISVALEKSVQMTADLMDAEFKGRGDREYLARYRLSQKTGVAERYLYRLQYQWRGMKDVAGEAYRLLDIAHRKYIQACESNEATAAEMRAERLRLRNEDAIDQEPDQHRLGMDSASLGAQETEGEAE